MKNLLIVLSFFMFVFLLGGCADQMVPDDLTDESVKNLIVNLKYAKDPRTGLCYAVTSSFLEGMQFLSSTVVITNVPCEECEELLIN